MNKIFNLILGIFTAIVLFFSSALLTPSPVVYHNQTISIMSEQHDTFTILFDMTVDVTSPYSAQISWMIDCGNGETHDVGRKTQSRVVGTYRVKNVFNVPTSIVGKNCEFSSIFSWSPAYSGFTRTIISQKVKFRINKDHSIISAIAG